MSNFSEISVAILAGGFGTRLSKITGKNPKVLAKIENRPFLKYLLDQLNEAGFKNIVICTGYLNGQVKGSLGKRYKNLKLLYSQEESPLGTAGAFRKALPLLQSEIAMLMNGDSFCEVNYEKFYQFHINKNSNASIVVTSNSDTSQSGKVIIGNSGIITQFQEKREGSGPGLINAGIYLINKSFIEKIPDGRKISIEKDIFPKWIGKGFYGFKSAGNFIDIGTPENYAKAEKFFTKLKS